MLAAASPSSPPEGFVFWTPPAGRCLLSGPEQHRIPLPGIPLPIRSGHLPAEGPSDSEIGESLYACLRRDPDGPASRDYARILGAGFPHLIADIGAQVVMLDAKALEPGYLRRKLALLKILALLDEANPELLFQIGRGLFELALEFAELPHCRRHLLESLSWLQRARVLRPEDPRVRSYLGEIDFILGDYPGAARHWLAVSARVTDAELRQRLSAKLAQVEAGEVPPAPLLDDLEALGQALVLAGEHRDGEALELLADLSRSGGLLTWFPLPEFHYLEGSLLERGGDGSAAMRSYHAALALDPQFAPALAAAERLATS